MFFRKMPCNLRTGYANIRQWLATSLLLCYNMFQHSFYRRFLASFLGMVFLTCALLSVVWVSFLLRALNAAMEEDQYDRLCLAVNDLDRQIEIMDEISLNISV